jgi:pimeloyl-ACP methyl ester carboxylesterase
MTSAAATTRAIEQAAGPVVLVGHSYGGIVITQAGNLPEVKALVYVAAFAPDANENLAAVWSKFPPATNNVVKSADGFLTLNQETFHHDFAADLPKADADFMALSQVPVSEKALSAVVKDAAWRSKPSWYAVATEDKRSIPTSNVSWRSGPEASSSRSREATRCMSRSPKRSRT